MLLAAVALADDPRTISLQDALESIQQEGLTIFYSSALVQPHMQVAQMPAAGSPRERLDELLDMFDLRATPGPRGSVMIVRVAPDERRMALGAEPSPEQAATATTLDPPVIEEVRVEASRYRVEYDVVTSLQTLMHDDIENAPDVGEDALRSIARLPGFATNGFSVQQNVRGGGVGEMLVRFDGLRLYEPYHLQQFQGIFSTIDPRIVKAMTVYTGAFPAIYGDRLSSVVEVESLSPPADRYYEVALSLFNASTLSAGRFDGGRGEWTASLRRSNLDLLYSAFSSHQERPRYLDAYAKLSYEVGGHLRLAVNALYFADDILLTDDVDLEEQAFSDDHDRYAWITLDHELGKLSGTTLIAHTRLAASRRGVTSKEGLSTGRLDDRRSFEIETLQSEWTWATGHRTTVRFGGSASRLDGRYAYRDEVEYDMLFDAPNAPDSPVRSRNVTAQPGGQQYHAFTSVLYRPTTRWAVDVGLRVDQQDVAAHTYRTADPRVSVSYSIAPATTLKLGWGRFHQFQNITEMEAEERAPRFHRPQRAQQTVLAVEHRFEQGPTLRIEAYDKHLSDLRPRYENSITPLTILPELKPDRVEVAATSARARGTELLLTGRPVDGASWWVAYTHSRVVDRIDGRSVVRSWDQPDALSAGLSWELRRWSFALGLIRRSGWPTTPIEHLRLDSEPPIVRTSQRNGARVDGYRSLDIRLSRNFELASGSFVAFLEVNNVLDRNNLCCVEYEVEENQAGDLQLDLSSMHYLPRVPSIGFVWRLGSSRPR